MLCWPGLAWRGCSGLTTGWPLASPQDTLSDTPAALQLALSTVARAEWWPSLRRACPSATPSRRGGRWECLRSSPSAALRCAGHACATISHPRCSVRLPPTTLPSLPLWYCTLPSLYYTVQLIAYAQANHKVIIGPATVGGVQVGVWGGAEEPLRRRSPQRRVERCGGPGGYPPAPLSRPASSTRSSTPRTIAIHASRRARSRSGTPRARWTTSWRAASTAPAPSAL